MSSSTTIKPLRIKGAKEPINKASSKTTSKKSKHSKKRTNENENTGKKVVETATERSVTGDTGEAAYLRNESGLTESELKTMLLKLKKDKEYAKKISQKSYRERIEDFNKKLSSTSEHFDMPRIGPG